MPYTTTVTALDTEGGPATIPVTARLWMLWQVLDTGAGGPTGNMQDARESQELQLPISLTNPATISFNQDADFTNVSRMVGLSIQDTNRVASDTGWLFRSGVFAQSVPADPIEIVASRIDILAADVPGLLPTVPMSVDSQTTITTLTATLAQDGIDVMASGTTTKTGVVVGFNFSGKLVLAPSSDIAAAEGEALSVGISNPALVFVSGPSVLSAIEAEILNLLRVFIVREAFPQLRANLEQRINAAVIASAGRALPGGALPQGVIASVRSISINPSRVQVRAALGAFGGVFSKLPQPEPGPSGTRTCPIMALATMGHAITGMAALREVRDARLAETATGRRLIAAYYLHGDEISELLRTDSGLARRAARAADELASVLGAALPVPAELRARAEGVLRDLAWAGSPQLRASLAEARAARPWRLV